MKTKNFIIGGIAGGIINFLGGWVFYGMLFKNQFPEGENMNMLFIILGCMTFGFLLSYIFNKWANINTLNGGLMAGAILGLFLGLWSNFFQARMLAEPDYQLMLLDVGISIAMGALTGAGIGLVNSKMK
jgi:hypothetical protein